MAGGNSHQRAMEKAAKERMAKKVTEAVLQELQESSKSPTPMPKKSFGKRLFDFIEHPLTLGALFLFAGIVGAILFTPALVVCAVCVLLGFHRARVVADQSRPVRVFVFVILALVISIGGYFLYGVLDSALQKIQTDFAKKVASFIKPSSPTTTDSKTSTAQHETKAQDNPNAHARVTPRDTPPVFAFRDKSPDYFTLLMGGTTFNLGKEMLNKPGGWHGFASVDGYEPLTMYVKDGALHIDAVVQDYEGHVTHKIENGGTEITVLPPRWDRNWTNNEVEIVDDREVPVFQMIVHRPSVIELYAIFYGTHGSVIASPPRRRLFKYPSWEHSGERVTE